MPIKAYVWMLRTATADELTCVAQGLEAGAAAAVISTCTRVEYYAAGEAPAFPKISPPIVLETRAALEHLAVVAAGADSLVVGETDILAQVRAAFASSSGDLRAFGDAAIAAGREARRRIVGEARDAGCQLDIALSVAGAKPPENLAIVGTGAMAAHLARRGRRLGCGTIALSGRSFNRSRSCTATANARAVPIEALADAAREAWLILAYRGLAEPAMRRHVLQAAGGAALVVDLTMPPFDWEANRPKSLIDLELMVRSEGLLRADLELQHALAGAAADVVRDQWERHFSSTSAAPRLYQRVEEVRQHEVARGLRHPNADPELLDAVTKALVKRLFHRYAQTLREEQDPALIAATERFFRFDEN